MPVSYKNFMAWRWCCLNISNLLDGIELPVTYKREGRLCYYDTYRKKLIEITPEETIRQQVAALFESQFGVPKDMIFLEVPMSHYVDGVPGRADIVIHALNEESNSIYPIAVIECKNENVFLTDKVADQAIRYCNTLGAKYMIITNGIDLEFAVYDESSDVYIVLDEILPYDKMINKIYSIPEIPEEEFVRFTLDQLQDQNLLSEYNDSGTWIFGEGTSDKLRSFAVNFYQSLLDTNHQLPKATHKCFELLEDIGLRNMDYSNAGGGHYNGIYRSFLVKDRFSEPQIISFSIFGTDANFRREHRNSYTSLTVAIDRFKTSHNSLQYNLDRYATFLPNNQVLFLHNGQISGFKSDDVKSMIALNGDGVKVDSSGIELGSIAFNKVLFLDDKDVSEFIYNLIEYALLREEFRKSKK